VNDKIEADPVNDLLVNGKLVVPRNTRVIGHITEARAQAKFLWVRLWESRLIKLRCLVSFGESRNWFGVVTLDEPKATITVVDGKVEAADFTDQPPIPLHCLLTLTSCKMLPSQETTFGGLL